VTVFGGVLIFARLRGRKMQETGKTGRNEFLTRGFNFSTYRRKIAKYLPFVLIRCSKYTNSYRLAEIIAIYAFICSYLLSQILDGVNETVIIDNMVGVVGEDLGKGADSTVNGQLLFEDDNILFAARELAEMDTKELLAKIRLRMDYLECFFDREQFQRINDTVMNYLSKNGSQHLTVAKRLY